MIPAHQTKDNNMSIDKKGYLRVIGWSINVKWSDGQEENLTDCDDDTASAVDTWLNEIEEERNN